MGVAKTETSFPASVTALVKSHKQFTSFC